MAHLFVAGVEETAYSAISDIAETLFTPAPNTA